jgi:hypothetical protein
MVAGSDYGDSACLALRERSTYLACVIGVIAGSAIVKVSRLARNTVVNTTSQMHEGLCFSGRQYKLLEHSHSYLDFNQPVFFAPLVLTRIFVRG